jgi:hypothetical protein
MFEFDYPTALNRRHGPDGYHDYESFRDWLRDEFLFRCVYCLHREQWYERTAMFNIDHFTPVDHDPEGKLEYNNLVYACGPCNNAKRNILGVPDPAAFAFSECVKVGTDGEIVWLNQTGELLVLKMRLNSDKNVRWRSRWIRNLAALRIQDPVLYQEYMGFPVDLPDLRKKKVPRNSLSDGVKDCYFAKRERGELPSTY